MANTPKRKGYHHGDLRRALIDAALELIEAHGVHALSLRQAARLADVSSGAPYRHFADKEALLAAISQEASERFEEFVSAELKRCEDTDPVTAFRARGIAFVTFAAAHPVHFRLMCNPDIAVLSKPSAEPTLADELSVRSELADDAPVIALAGRSMAYGLARMIVDDQLPDLDRSPEAIRELAVRVLDVLGTGIVGRD